MFGGGVETGNASGRGAALLRVAEQLHRREFINLISSGIPDLF